MPTLKIGCRVYHPAHGEAVLVSYDGTSPRPWTLATTKGNVLANHAEFSRAELEPAVNVATSANWRKGRKSLWGAMFPKVADALQGVVVPHGR